MDDLSHRFPSKSDPGSHHDARDVCEPDAEHFLPIAHFRFKKEDHGHHDRHGRGYEESYEDVLHLFGHLEISFLIVYATLSRKKLMIGSSIFINSIGFSDIGDFSIIVEGEPVGDEKG